MGIKKFFEDLRKVFGYKCGKLSIDDMKNKRLVVDVSLLIYKAKYASSIYNTNPVTRYFMRFICRFFKINTYVILIFDGKPTHLKEKTGKKRYEKRLKTIEKIGSLEKKLNELSFDSLDNIHYEKKIKSLKKELSLVPTEKEIQDLKALCNELSILNYTTSGHDAENLCAYLNKNGYADYVMSADSDVFAFGGKNIVHGYKNYLNVFDCHYLSDILKSFGFSTVNQIIHYAILVGNDYNERIKGNGPVTSNNIVLYNEDDGKSVCKKLYDNYTEIYDEYTMEFPDVENDVKIILELSNEEIIKCSINNMNVDNVKKIIGNDQKTIDIFTEFFC
jgi:flap endonuclease GEN